MDKQAIENMAKQAHHHMYERDLSFETIEDIKHGWCRWCESWESNIYKVKGGYYCHTCDTMYHIRG
jgi:hypothetical protein